jgi:hypothetical protein
MNLWSTTIRRERGASVPIYMIALAALAIAAIGWVGFSFLGQSGKKSSPPQPASPQSRFNKLFALPPPSGMYPYWISHMAGAKVRRMSTKDRYTAYKQWLTNNPQKAHTWWVRQMNSDTRIILGEVRVDANNYFTHHGNSLDGFTPALAQRWWTKHVRAKFNKRWIATASIPPSTYTFDAAQTAEIGAVSIRVADGGQLLVVTRSMTDTPYCGVVSPAATGEGIGDAHDVNSCTIIWSAH